MFRNTGAYGAAAAGAGGNGKEGQYIVSDWALKMQGRWHLSVKAEHGGSGTIWKAGQGAAVGEAEASDMNRNKQAPEYIIIIS